MSHWSRVVDLEGGIAMIVTDLHGDWDAYRRYRDHFLALLDRGEADYLILTGDLVHFTGPEREDRSLDIVLDVLDLARALGERLILLLGNHELPHLHNYILAKGDHFFTPRFQMAMGEHRNKIIAFFETLPFFVRTRGGVVICHAGVSDVVRQPGGLAQLFDLRHADIAHRVSADYPSRVRPPLRQRLAEQYGRSYGELVHEWFAVTDSNDPRYDDFLIGSIAMANCKLLQLLFAMVSTRNELQFEPSLYSQLLQETLETLSAGYHQQRVMLSGHMDCRGGYTVVSTCHLRLASAKNAHPRETGQFLLLEVAQRTENARELLPRLGSVFKPLSTHLA